MQCMCIQMKPWLHVDLPWMHWSFHQPSQRWDPHCKQLPVEMTRLHSWWRQCQTSMLLCTWNHSCTGIADVHVHERVSVDALHEHNCQSFSDSLPLSLSLTHTRTQTHNLGRNWLCLPFPYTDSCFVNWCHHWRWCTGKPYLQCHHCSHSYQRELHRSCE